MNRKYEIFDQKVAVPCSDSLKAEFIQACSTLGYKQSEVLRDAMRRLIARARKEKRTQIEDGQMQVSRAAG